MSSLIAPFEGKRPTGKDLTMLQGDARLIIVAGSDTTAATMAFIYQYLAKYPAEVDKLRAELDPLVGASGEITHSKIIKAEHLNGLIYETLRLNPPVPSAMYRLTPPEGITINGTFIPGTTQVFCPQYVLSRSEKAYEKATEFYPERWYKEPDMVKNKTCWGPFSMGVYGCIGKPLALLEIRTLVTKLVMKYDVAFAPGETGKALMEDFKDHFTLGLQDLNLVFTPRKA